MSGDIVFQATRRLLWESKSGSDLGVAKVATAWLSLAIRKTDRRRSESLFSLGEGTWMARQPLGDLCGVSMRATRPRNHGVSLLSWLKSPSRAPFLEPGASEGL